MSDDIIARLEKGNEDFLKERAKRGVGCPKCNWMGYLVIDEKAENCECWLKSTMERMCRAANVPRNYIGMTLENDWNPKQDANNQDTGSDEANKLRIKRCVAQYIKNLVPLCAGLKLRLANGREVTNLMFVGESRSGKTLLSSIIAQEAIKKGLITQFINWIDLEPIFSDFDAREEQNRIVEDCKNADLVVIDGVENLGVNNPYYLSGLERIASARINKGQPTVISAFSDYTEIRSRHNWTSLIDNAYKIHLPSPRSADSVDNYSPPTKPKGHFRKHRAGETE